MSHFETGTLEATLDIKALIDLGAIEDTLHAHTPLINHIQDLAEINEIIPYSNPLLQPHNLESE